MYPQTRDPLNRDHVLVVNAEKDSVGSGAQGPKVAADEPTVAGAGCVAGRRGGDQTGRHVRH